MFASAGDDDDTTDNCAESAPSGVRGVSLPASDPLITAVGGTTLSVNPVNDQYAGETVWNQQQATGGHQSEGSGGGVSALFTRPA